MAQKSFRISDEICKQLDELASTEQLSQSQLLEKMILEYCPQGSTDIPDGDGSAGANFQKKKNDDVPPDTAFTQDDREMLKLVKYICNDNNKKLFVLSEVMNSLVSSALRCFPTQFRSTTDKSEIHEWFLQAQDSLEKTIQKKIRGD